MKKLIIFFLPLFLLAVSSCETQNPWEDFQPGNGGFGPGGMPGGAPGGQGGATSGALIDLNILSSFTVEFNETSLAEQETIPSDEANPDFGQYIENDFSPKNTTTIHFTDKGAEIDGIVKGDTI